MAHTIDPRGIDPFAALSLVRIARQQFGDPGNPFYDEEADRVIARAVSLAVAGLPGFLNTAEEGAACLVGAAMAVYLIKNGEDI